MAIVQRVTGDLYVSGELIASAIRYPAGGIGAADVESAAGIEASKLEHQHQQTYTQASATTAAADRRVIHVVQGATGSVEAIQASAVTKMSSGGGDDKAVTVDLYKNGSSILSAPISMTKTTLTANYLLLDGTITSATLAADDVLEIVVAVSGSTGTQALGVFAVVKIREDAD